MNLLDYFNINANFIKDINGEITNINNWFNANLWSLNSGES